MKILLDTHILLWVLSNDTRLPKNMIFVTHDSLIPGYDEPCILVV